MIKRFNLDNGWKAIVFDNRELTPRTYARVLDIAYLARVACDEAIHRNRDYIVVRDGGDVANAYHYPALTDGVVAVALRDERIVVLVAERLPANKVTHGGVLAHCLGEHARPFADGRYSEARRLRARQEIIERARGWAREYASEPVPA
jgi:hypothetical protein